MAQVKERGEGWEERKETLADKSLDSDSDSPWPVMPEFTHRHLMLSLAVIIGQYCPSVERK